MRELRQPIIDLRVHFSCFFIVILKIKIKASNLVNIIIKHNLINNVIYIFIRLENKKMIDYSEKICEACSIDAPVASDSLVSEFLENHLEWKLANDREFPQIVRVYKFSQYLLGLNFVHAVAKLSEEEGHHPDILLEYGQVTVRWWSHKIKNLHVNDFIMAAKCDKAYNN